MVAGDKAVELRDTDGQLSVTRCVRRRAPRRRLVAPRLGDPARYADGRRGPHAHWTRGWPFSWRASGGRPHSPRLCDGVASSRRRHGGREPHRSAAGADWRAPRRQRKRDRRRAIRIVAQTAARFADGSAASAEHDRVTGQEVSVIAIEVECARSLCLRIIPTLTAACLMVQAATAQQQPAPEVLEYKGTVAAAREVEVAPRLDALLSEINFVAGQFVKKGDLLFIFAAKSNELSLALAQANLKQAEAQLRLAEVTLKNKQVLRARNVASEMQYLEAEAQRDIAAAKADQARANVQIAEITLHQTKRYAPIAGLISRPWVKEGTYITKEARDQSRLATIVQLDPIHVVGRAPALMYLQRGETSTSIEQTAAQRDFALILPTGDKYAHKGRLAAGAYEFDPVTQTTEVTVEFPNPDNLLRPGLNVTLQSSVRSK